PERLVFTSAALDESGKPLFDVLNTVAFVEHDGTTKLTVRARVVKSTAGAAPYLAGMEAGWTQSLERLGVYLAGTADREIVATRMLFESSRERDRVVKKFGAIEGLSQTLDRLEAYVGESRCS